MITFDYIEAESKKEEGTRKRRAPSSNGQASE
jgi:hypothetical protein